MPKAYDFVETEAIAENAMPQTSDTPRRATCPLCDHEVGDRVVTTRIPVLMPDGMWGHIFRPAHPYCAHMYEQGYAWP